MELLGRYDKSLKLLGIGLVGLIFAVGALTIFQKLSSFVAAGSNNKGGKLTVLKDADKADFAFLEPGYDKAWNFDINSPIVDKTKGLVSYKVSMTDSKANITLSQQQMPDELKPQSSAKFMKLVLDSNVISSQEAGDGKVYFRQALTNGGVTAAGSTQVIYATDKFLMFAQADTLVSYVDWVKLLGTMKPEGSTK